MTAIRQIAIGIALIAGYAAAMLLWLVLDVMDTLAAWRGKR